MNHPKIGETVTFQCVPQVDGCTTAHTGQVTATYDVTPTLTLIDFTDQYGDEMSVNAADLQVTA